MINFDDLPELSASPQLSTLLRHGLTELTRGEARTELRLLLDQAFQSGITSERESKKLMKTALRPRSKKRKGK